MEIGELEEALIKARKNSGGLEINEKSGVLHALLDEIARQKNYFLKVRRSKEIFGGDGDTKSQPSVLPLSGTPGIRGPDPEGK